jgi:hypothetical protein
MTQVTTPVFNSSIRTGIWYIINPTSGTNNVVVDYSSTPLANATVIWTCSGVDTTAPIGTPATATGSGTAVSVTVTDSIGDVTIDMFGANLQTSGPTLGADQTLIHSGNDGAELGWGVSYQSGDGGVMSWTNGVSEVWSQMGVAVSPAAAASILQSPPLPVFLFE